MPIAGSELILVPLAAAYASIMTGCRHLQEVFAQAVLSWPNIINANLSV